MQITKWTTHSLNTNGELHVAAIFTVIAEDLINDDDTVIVEILK